MRLENLPSEFQKALPLLEKIRAAGYQAYFVGGSVRDAILGRPIHDVDIATSSYPQETKAIFERTVDVGIEHGTVLVLDSEGEYEVTTFRTEDVYVDYRRPKSVAFVRSLEEDLKRRDFTVNALALDDKGQIIDLFDGLLDLEAGLLRAVGRASERFNEDALRIMRGLRFSASLNFQIEEDTLSAMREQGHLLTKISVERSFIEMDKLLTAPHWQKGLSALLETGVYDYLPGLAGSGQALEKALSDLAEGAVFASSEQAWAYLLIQLGCQEVKTFLKAWKTSVHFQRTVENLVTIYQYRLSELPTKALVYQYGKDILHLVEDLREKLGLSTEADVIDQLDRELQIHSKQEMAINGADLMRTFDLKPGPELGEHLARIEAALVEGDLTNDRQAIFAFVEGMQHG